MSTKWLASYDCADLITVDIDVPDVDRLGDPFGSAVKSTMQPEGEAVA